MNTSFSWRRRIGPKAEGGRDGARTASTDGPASGGRAISPGRAPLPPRAACPARRLTRAQASLSARHGCRSAITEHAARLAAATRVEDLAPSVFAATVHNTVSGELAIALGLGGISETIVAGRTAGLEALILGARRVAGGDADRVLVVAAEGIDDAMRAGVGRRDLLSDPVLRASSWSRQARQLLLEAENFFEWRRKSRERVRFLDGCLFFEPDARRAAARFFEWVNGVEARAGENARPAAVTLCTPDYEDFLEGYREKEPRVDGSAPRACTRLRARSLVGARRPLTGSRPIYLLRKCEHT